MVTLRDIVIDALKKMGADGVCNLTFHCFCRLNNLGVPCGFNPLRLSCAPAKKKIATTKDVANKEHWNIKVGDEIFVRMED